MADFRLVVPLQVQGEDLALNRRQERSQFFPIKWCRVDIDCADQVRKRANLPINVAMFRIQTDCIAFSHRVVLHLKVPVDFMLDAHNSIIAELGRFVLVGFQGVPETNAADLDNIIVVQIRRIIFVYREIDQLFIVQNRLIQSGHQGFTPSARYFARSRR